MMIRFQDLIFAMMIFVSKIYEEKTIEVGVYIDRHLYKNMEEVPTFLLLLLYTVEMSDLPGTSLQEYGRGGKIVFFCQFSTAKTVDVLFLKAHNQEKDFEVHNQDVCCFFNIGFPWKHWKHVLFMLPVNWSDVLPCYPRKPLSPC